VVADACLVEQALGQCGLAGIDVRDDAEVEPRWVQVHSVTALEGSREARAR
jgi:hypothetical protein